jgi:hypothetical protein
VSFGGLDLFHRLWLKVWTASVTDVTVTARMACRPSPVLAQFSG